MTTLPAPSKTRPQITHKILLTAPRETLRKRVSTRIALPDTYQGTLEELEFTIQEFEDFNSFRFHRIFDTEEHSPDNIAAEIKQMIETPQE